MQKFGAVFGLLVGLFSIFGSFLAEGGSFHTLFLFTSMIIVFGGTFSAIIIGFGLDKFTTILPLIKLAYFPRKFDIQRLIDNFVDLSIKARREGLLTIEKDLSKFQDLFPRKMTKFALDGTDPDSLQSLGKFGNESNAGKAFFKYFHIY